MTATKPTLNGAELSGRELRAYGLLSPQQRYHLGKMSHGSIHQVLSTLATQLEAQDDAYIDACEAEEFRSGGIQ